MEVGHKGEGQEALTFVGHWPLNLALSVLSVNLSEPLISYHERVNNPYLEGCV